MQTEFGQLFLTIAKCCFYDQHCNIELIDTFPERRVAFSVPRKNPTTGTRRYGVPDRWHGMNGRQYLYQLAL